MRGRLDAHSSFSKPFSRERLFLAGTTSSSLRRQAFSTRQLSPEPATRRAVQGRLPNLGTCRSSRMSRQSGPSGFREQVRE